MDREAQRLQEELARLRALIARVAQRGTPHRRSRLNRLLKRLAFKEKQAAALRTAGRGPDRLPVQRSARTWRETNAVPGTVRYAPRLSEVNNR